VAVDPNTHTVYVANGNSGSASVIDGNTNTSNVDWQKAVELTARFVIGRYINGEVLFAEKTKTKQITLKPMER
jgi:DNA-binding beta-propeller fold protein YncE